MGYVSIPSPRQILSLTQTVLDSPSPLLLSPGQVGPRVDVDGHYGDDGKYWVVQGHVTWLGDGKAAGHVRKVEIFGSRIYIFQVSQLLIKISEAQPSLKEYTKYRLSTNSIVKICQHIQATCQSGQGKIWFNCHLSILAKPNQIAQ